MKIKHKVIFVKYKKFDNSSCVRKLPYDGQSWFVIKSIHLKRFQYLINNSSNDLEFSNPNNWIITNSENMTFNKIYALDYLDANAYVMGANETLPALLEFNASKHCADWQLTTIARAGYSQKELLSLNIPYWCPIFRYQVLIK